MEKALISAQKFFEKWKIKINHAKTQAILFPFNKSPKRIPTQMLSVNNTIIPLQKSVKYLGIIFDQKLNFREHIEYTCEKSVKCGRALYPLLNRKSRLNHKNKMLIFNTCIRPIMTYGCPVWYPRAAKTNVKKLQIIQNKNLKIICNLHRRFPTYRLHEKCNQKVLSTLLAELSQRFVYNCNYARFEEIRNLYA